MTTNPWKRIKISSKVASKGRFRSRAQGKGLCREAFEAHDLWDKEGITRSALSSQQRELFCVVIEAYRQIILH